MPACKEGNQLPGFVCTGSDEGHIWKMIHKEIPKKFHCDHCGNEFEQDMRGYHDVVNLGLGKDPINMKDLLRLQKRVNLAVNSAIKKGFSFA